MPDHATPNLPSSDFSMTSAFYAALGFQEGWRDDGWMILTRGALTLEFFAYPDVDPRTSSFGSCLRLDDLDAFYAVCKATGLPETCRASRACILRRPSLGAGASERSSIRTEHC